MLTSTQTAILTLWQQVNASLSAYHKLVAAFGSAYAAITATDNQWQQAKIHASHIKRRKQTNDTQTFIKKVEEALTKKEYQLIFTDEDAYPAQLKQIYDPPPVLFAKGNISQLQNVQIAMVGSRQPSPHAQKISFDMAQYLAKSGYVITSGLAQGVDKQAHLGALAQDDANAKGRTVGVLGTGIDVVYPRQHHDLYNQILTDGGCLVTELLPSTPASRHTFPRRNRLVAGLSIGTIVTEATIKSGSLITAKLTSDQGKQVFAIPSHINNANAEGCHHLIREGATLIYHPDQVIEDLQYQDSQPKNLHKRKSMQPQQATAQNSSKTSQTIKADKTADLPTHLQPIYTELDWTGIDLDNLVNKLQLDTQTLLGQLIELELMGLVMQQGGRYLRV